MFKFPDFLMEHTKLRRATFRLLLTYARVTGRALPAYLEDWVLLARMKEIYGEQRPKSFEWQVGDKHYWYVGLDPASFCKENSLPLPD